MSQAKVLRNTSRTLIFKQERDTRKRVLLYLVEDKYGSFHVKHSKLTLKEKKKET